MSNGIEHYSSSDDDFQIPSDHFACDFRRFRSNNLVVDTDTLLLIVHDANLGYGSSTRSDEVVYFHSSFRWFPGGRPSYLLLFDESIRSSVLSVLGSSPSVRAFLDFVGPRSPRLSRFLFGFNFLLSSSRIRFDSSDRRSLYVDMADDFILFLDGSPSLYQFILV
jgi:hypothetical protein